MPDITAEERDRLLRVMADAVCDLRDGRINWADYTMTLACCALAANGVSDPRLSEVHAKAAEITAAAHAATTFMNPN